MILLIQIEMMDTWLKVKSKVVEDDDVLVIPT